MPEVFFGNYEKNQIEEGNKENSTTSFNDTEKITRDNYLRNKNRDGAKELAVKQVNENENLKEKSETNVLKETRDDLDKQAMINEAKTMLYEKMGISDNLGDNNWGENFGKGLVDALILDNYDLAIQVWETKGKVIINSIRQLFSSWDNIKKLAESLGESVIGLFSGDGYKTGKSVVELGLIGGGVSVGIYAGKKTIKFGMNQISKLRKPAERVVESADTKKVIGLVNDKVNEIVPKQEVNVEGLAQKSFNIERQVRELEELGIPEKFSKDILESGLMNEKFLGGDLLKRFKALNKKGINYEGMIDDAIKKIPNLTKEEALLIFSYTDNIIYRKLNAYMRGDKDVLANMTKENIEATNRLISKLEDVVEKMPNMIPGKDGLILRGDKWEGRKREIGDNIELKSFTSVANNKKDAFIGEGFKTNMEISILGKEGRVKDISSLSIGVIFGDKLKGITKTTNEGIILPNSVVKIIGKDLKIRGEEVINEVKVRQIR